jgi:BirA family biotin operon repressor/biotin-[acetyl-CoA-carboxylase] ligase
MRIYRYKIIGSTNEKAKKILKKNPSTPVIVVSERQTKGKGRKTHTWYSNSSGGLYYTIALIPKNNLLKDLSTLNLSIAKITSNIIYKLSKCKLTIEWPNDLILDHKKVGGILIETTATSSKIKHLIIGIGLNLNQKTFPTYLKPIAISLSQKTGKKYIKDQFIELLNQKIIAKFT